MKVYCENPNVFVSKLDSTDSATLSFVKSLERRFRFFSIDGGHTVQYLLSDLRIAEETLSNGGFVLVDDYCSPGFPGVAEGIIGYLQRGGRLLPVCAAGGKLIMTTLSYRDMAQQHIRGALKASGLYRSRDTPSLLCGYPYIYFKVRGRLPPFAA